MTILLGRDTIFYLRDIFAKDLYGRYANRDRP